MADHQGHLEAADADLRQADDLLPAVDADDGRHPRDPDHHDARVQRRSSARCSATASSSASASSTRCSRRPTGSRRRSSSARSSSATSRVALVLGDNIFHGAGLGSSLREQQRDRRCADLRLPRRRTRRPTASSSSTTTSRAISIEEKPREAEEQLRGARPLLLRQRRRRDREVDRAERARRARDLDGQRALPRRGRAAGAGARPRHRLARHRHLRVDDAGVRVRARDRGPPGLQDRLHRGDRLARRLDRRRDARHLAEPLVKSGYGTYLRRLLGA